MLRFVLGLMGLALFGCACGAESVQAVDADLTGDDLSFLEDPGNPTAEDCESMCSRAAGGNVVEVSDCELDVGPMGGSDTAGTAVYSGGHVQCTATVTNICE